MRSRVNNFLSVQPSLQYPVYRISSIAAQMRALVFRNQVKQLEASAPMLIIVGAGRSGNTILRKLLMERGSIYIPPETYVWSSQIHALLRAPALRWEERVALFLGQLEFSAEFETFQLESLRSFAAVATSWPASQRSLGNLIQSLYHWLAAEKGIPAQWVGEKTPMNLSRVGLVEKMFPEARYVYIERDGVDVAISYRNCGLYGDLASGARRWMQSRQAWLRFSATIQKNRQFCIRFKDLVVNHEFICDATLNHFGIPLRYEKIDVSYALGDVFARSHHASVRAPVTGVRTASAGRESLTAAEREQLRRIFRNSLTNAGYEPV